MRSSRECFGKKVNENGYNDEDSVFHSHINNIYVICRNHAEQGKFDIINFSAHLIDKIVKVFDKVKLLFNFLSRFLVRNFTTAYIMNFYYLYPANVSFQLVFLIFVFN